MNDQLPPVEDEKAQNAQNDTTHQKSKKALGKTKSKSFRTRIRKQDLLKVLLKLDLARPSVSDMLDELTYMLYSESIEKYNEKMAEIQNDGMNDGNNNSNETSVKFADWFEDAITIADVRAYVTIYAHNRYS